MIRPISPSGLLVLAGELAGGPGLEAVALAEELSTDASGRFVNGLLGRLATGEEGVPRLP